MNTLYCNKIEQGLWDNLYLELTCSTLTLQPAPTTTITGNLKGQTGEKLNFDGRI